MAESRDILSLKIKCGDAEVDVPFDGVMVTASEDECELCGSHGSVEVEVDCPHCKKHHAYILREW